MGRMLLPLSVSLTISLPGCFGELRKFVRPSPAARSGAGSRPPRPPVRRPVPVAAEPVPPGRVDPFRQGLSGSSRRSRVGIAHGSPGWQHGERKSMWEACEEESQR
ncbi:hypothetical protein GCM10010495_28960 [Kitasatospora herbaricolor]|nr:hypothetical protein GCM10010495_28960 [Kitasatospora herbaricolor]